MSHTNRRRGVNSFSIKNYAPEITSKKLPAILSITVRCLGTWADLPTKKVHVARRPPPGNTGSSASTSPPGAPSTSRRLESAW